MVEDVRCYECGSKLAGDGKCSREHCLNASPSVVIKPSKPISRAEDKPKNVAKRGRKK